MKRKRILTTAVLLTFTALLVLIAWAGRLGYVSSHSLDSQYALENDVQDLRDAVNQSGVNALNNAQFSTWADQDAHANALVLDEDGKVLGRMNNLFFGDAEQVKLMISPYICESYVKYNAENSESTLWLWRDGRVVLWMDGQNNLQDDVFFAVDPTPILGASLPEYRTYFPVIDETAFQMVTGDWFSSETFDGSNLLEQNIPTKADLLRAQQYVKWQEEQVQEAGVKTISLYTLGNGQTLLVAYYSDGTLNRSQIAADLAGDQLGPVVRIMELVVILFILLLAMWVFLDARSRGFKPALWGVLTLIGNVVAWIVYMMVRPEGHKALSCPVCGTAIKREYVVCPMCTAPLKRSCAGCGNALEPEWKACPFCGDALNKSETV